MSFMDRVDALLQRLRQGTVRGDGSLEPNLPNGGHTGYHPPVQPRQRRSSTGDIQMQGAGGYTGTFSRVGYQAGQMTGYQPAGSWPQQTGYQPSGQWQQTASPYTGQWQQTGYQAQDSWQKPQQAADAWQQPQQTAYQQRGGFQAEQAPAGFAQNQQDPLSWQRSQQSPRRRGAQPQEAMASIAYMPGNFVGDDGVAYRHVERLTQPLSAASCYRLIEFMRNGETVIVNTELIRDERENQRCLDLLFGAAFTMQCTFTRISAKSIYLIAPGAVSVIPYESIRQMNEQDAAMRWPGAEESGSEEARARRGYPFRGEGDARVSRPAPFSGYAHAQ